MRLKKEAVLKKHSGCVNSLSWYKDSLLSASDDCLLCVWNPYSLQLKSSFHSSHSANIFSAHFLSDSLIASCAADGAVKLFSTTSSSSSSFNCHSHMAFQILVSPSDPFLFWSCSDDGTVNQYDTRIQSECMCSSCNNHILIDINSSYNIPSSKSSPNTNQSALPQRLQLLSQFLSPILSRNGRLGVTAISIHPIFSEYLAVASTNGSVNIFDRRSITRNSTPIYSYSPVSSKITCAQFDPSVTQVSYLIFGDSVYLARPDQGFTGNSSDHTFMKYSGHSNLDTMIKEATFYGKSSEFIMSGSDDGYLFIWSKNSGKFLSKVRADKHVVNCIAPGKYDSILAVSGIDDDIKIFWPGFEDGEDSDESFYESEEEEDTDFDDEIFSRELFIQYLAGIVREVHNVEEEE